MTLIGINNEIFTGKSMPLIFNHKDKTKEKQILKENFLLLMD